MIFSPTCRIASLIAMRQKDITVELQRKRRLESGAQARSRILQERTRKNRRDELAALAACHVL
jgi:hypothetical protein